MLETMGILGGEEAVALQSVLLFTFMILPFIGQWLFWGGFITLLDDL
jgi:hypothetical protein